MIAIRILSLVFVLLGIVLLTLSVSELRRRKEFIERASLARGAITEVIRRRASTSMRGSSFATRYYYRVRYDTGRGESVEFVNSDWHGSPEYRVGEEVPVLYHPDDPGGAAINSFSLLWFDFGLLSVLGACFLGAGSCNLWITASPAKRFRSGASVRELREAFRRGKLTRGSEYQGLLVALTFGGFAILGAALIVLVFASATAKLILAALVLYTLVQAVRARWRRRGRKPGRRA
jgi:hypothetical protein